MKNKKTIFYFLFLLIVFFALVVSVDAYSDPYVTSSTNTHTTTQYCNWNWAGVICDTLSADRRSWGGSTYLARGGNCSSCPSYASGSTGCHGDVYYNTCGGSWCANNPTSRSNYTRTTTYSSTSYVCHYISRVDNWIYDPNTGLELADEVTWSSVSGQSCRHVALSRVPPNFPPTASNLSIIKGDYCSIPSHNFSWTYIDADGDTQSRFILQIDNNNNFSSPSVNRDITGRSDPSPATNNQNLLVTTSPDSPDSDRLAYGTTYYWRVSVWDSHAASSGWINGSSFTTSLHQWPSVDFSWAPNEPSANENIQFTDQSTVYGGSSKSSWLWTFPDGTPANSGVQIPIVRFISSGVKDVILQVTDSDGYSCSKSSNNDVVIGEGLPGWEEIPPF